MSSIFLRRKNRKNRKRKPITNNCRLCALRVAALIINCLVRLCRTTCLIGFETNKKEQSLVENFQLCTSCVAALIINCLVRLCRTTCLTGFEKPQNCVLLASGVSYASPGVSSIAATTAAASMGSNPTEPYNKRESTRKSVGFLFLACLIGFEPTPFGVGVQRSIQLSYKHIINQLQ